MKVDRSAYYACMSRRTYQASSLKTSGLIGKNAIINTHQSSPYAAVEYRRLLFINGFRQSMSRRGNHYDNAQAESFFSRFKAELIEDGVFEDFEQARSKIFSYIEGHYIGSDYIRVWDTKARWSLKNS